MNNLNEQGSRLQEPVIISKADHNIKPESLLTRIRRVSEGTNTITFVGSAAGKNNQESLTLTWGELH
ncbi:MAG: hypothetical protein ACNA7Z_08850, partial [Dethiobacteria bacterium]